MKMKHHHRRRSDRYARRATRRGMSPGDARRVRTVVAAIAGGVAVIAVALVWGNILKARSDDYRARHPEVSWTLDAETATPAVPPAPAGDAAAMSPGGAVPRAYDTALLSLGTVTGRTDYDSVVLREAGVPLPEEVSSLAGDVSLIHAWGLTAAGLFEVSALDEEDPALAAYRRGLELARLTECASAGLDEIMLLGLPTGDAARDTAAAAFVNDLKRSLSELSDPPEITVILPPQDFARRDADGTWSYDRCLTPGRLLTACDYLAVDLTSVSAGAVESYLQGMQYPYVRYSLRLLIHGEATVPDETTGNGQTVTVEELAREHGFERLMIWHSSEVPME